MYQVLVAGATGKMGRKAVELIEQKSNFALAAVLAPSIADSDLTLPQTTQCFSDLSQINHSYDIWLDFTTPQAVYQNTEFALQHQMRPIIGTSGLTEQQVASLQQLAQQQQIGGLIAPNFGLSAVLLMKFAKMAAQYLPDAEIIELHHADKKDAPSGTALATAQQIQAGRTQPVKKTWSQNSARGLNVDGVPIHAVRLPGYIAHEEVLFGGTGEALTIRQDSFDRGSFMTGVNVALDKISDLTQLVFGLENLL
ncbi:4-hydroxy-tetrahydrodipicolinate reductase [Bombilactobacillus folatiphilus]|uniref:4-hydroxy-tetrahydrodipicolinate reductase n=1 Tax=Bombilactobacillus folatiphilus TaxID=2923362 RepID=A0ABY4PA20_9LACO|nr:4-hydroxy-tetrahydrodipicolinate reductase [Bombilactobacillus folatiphilus]UQS82523.1 4-hydroxy-tetrahydrodipicolinate reductase [Bombilactobacillus folatiphilus]